MTKSTISLTTGCLGAAMPGTFYPQVEDGEWVLVLTRGYKEQCCDCGLVHKHNFRVIKDGPNKGQIEVQSFRDSRATAAVRRGFKFEKDETP